MRGSRSGKHRRASTSPRSGRRRGCRRPRNRCRRFGRPGRAGPPPGRISCLRERTRTMSPRQGAQAFLASRPANVWSSSSLRNSLASRRVLGVTAHQLGLAAQPLAELWVGPVIGPELHQAQACGPACACGRRPSSRHRSAPSRSPHVTSHATMTEPDAPRCCPSGLTPVAQLRLLEPRLRRAAAVLPRVGAGQHGRHRDVGPVAPLLHRRDAVADGRGPRPSPSRACSSAVKAHHELRDAERHPVLRPVVLPGVEGLAVGADKVLEGGVLGRLRQAGGDQLARTSPRSGGCARASSRPPAASQNTRALTMYSMPISRASGRSKS